LHYGHAAVLRAALEALGAVGPSAAKPHLPAIEHLIVRNRSMVRLAKIGLDACSVIAKLGFATPELAEVVAEMLGGPDRGTACMCLVTLGPKLAAPHIPAIARRMQHPAHPNDRTDENDAAVVAMNALAKLGFESAKPYIGDIVKFLLSHKVHCIRALEVLNEFGCVSELASALYSPYAVARLKACEILTEHGSQVASPYATEFVTMLRDEFFPVRIAAFKALGSLGPFIQGQDLAAVVAHFADDNPNIRTAACEALVQLGAAKELAQYLQHDDPTICRQACVALGRLGPRAVPHMAAIQKLCSSTVESFAPGIGTVTLGEVAKDVLKKLADE